MELFIVGSQSHNLIETNFCGFIVSLLQNLFPFWKTNALSPNTFYSIYIPFSLNLSKDFRLEKQLPEIFRYGDARAEERFSVYIIGFLFTLHLW